MLLATLILRATEYTSIAVVFRELTTLCPVHIQLSSKQEYYNN